MSDQLFLIHLHFTHFFFFFFFLFSWGVVVSNLTESENTENEENKQENTSRLREKGLKVEKGVSKTDKKDQAAREKRIEEENLDFEMRFTPLKKKTSKWVWRINKK